MTSFKGFKWPFLLFLLSMCLPLFAQDYQLDKAHSRIAFKVRNLRFWVHGQFNTFSGHGGYDHKTGLISYLKVQINSASINSNDKDRDRHLRSADFLWAEKYPQIIFNAHKFDYSGAKKKRVKTIHGTINIRGVSKPISLDVKKIMLAQDPWGKQKLGFEVSGKLDRKSFGLTWNKGLKKAVSYLFVGDEVLLDMQFQIVI